MIRLKCPPNSRPYLPLVIVSIGELVLGEEGQHVADHQQLPGLLAGSHHPRGVGRISAIGFSQKTCLPAFRAAMVASGVPGRRQADVDQIEVRVGDQLVQLGVAGRCRQGP